MKPRKSNLLQCLTICLTPIPIALSVMMATPAIAASGTWTGTAADNLYNTSGNWTAAAPTANGDTATWNGTQAGALSILWNGAVGGSGGVGAALVLTSSQTGSVSLNNAANNSQLGLTGISIASGAGAFTLGGATGVPLVTLRSTGATVLLNDSTANIATIKSNVVFNSGGGGNRVITFDGAGNWQADNALVTPNGGALSVVKNGAGTLTITNANVSQNNGYTINAGTLAVAGAGLIGGPSGVFGGTLAITGGTLSYQSSASQTITSAISGSGALTQSNGSLTLTGNSPRTGSTTVTGGTMVLGGTGQMASSGLTLNGASAKFVQTSSVASTMPITLTQGTLDGTGSVGAVTVGNGTGGIIRNGNAGTGSLTISNLTFTGAGSLSFSEDGNVGTAGVIVTGALVTTPSNGTVTVNASQTSWTSGTPFNLLTFGSFTGGSLSDFTKGTISGLSVRQNSVLVLNATNLSLEITGENPVWSGLDNGNWVVGTTGANGNWKLIAANAKTDYIVGDNVLFDDGVTTGTTAVNISAANVSPALVTFNNSSKDYTVSGAFGIAAGSMIKTGSGKVTLSTVNTYNGGTTVGAGTLALSGAGTLGATTGALTVNGTGIVDLGGTSQILGTVSLNGTGTITNGVITPAIISATSSSAAVISASIAGSGSVVQAGTGSLTLSAANSYSGGTTATSGTLILSGAGTLGATTGALNLGGAALDLGTTSQTVGTVTKNGAGTISNGTLAFTVFNDTHTVGTGTVSAKLTGTGALNLTGAGGTLILSGANDYTGPTLVKSGTVLRLGDGGTSGSLSPLSDITVENGGRFSTNRSDTVTQGVDFGLLTGGVQGGLIINGTGTTVFNLANTFTAGGTMSAGTVVAASNGALGTGGNGDFSITGGSLHLKNDISLGFGSAIITQGAAATSDTVGSLMSSGTNSVTNAVTFGNAGTGNISNIVSVSGILTINGAMTASATGRTFNFGGAGNVVAAGAISGNVSVSKSGSGTTTLMNAANTYSGTTTVTAGKLVVNGNVSTSIITVGSGATLGGSGTLGGTATFASGAILAPGNSAGNLTLGNGLTLAGSYAWELVALSTASPGTNFDSVTVTAGNVNLTGSLLQLSLGAFAPSGDSFWKTDQIWNGIINNTGAGTLTGSFASIDNSSWSSLGTFSTNNTGNDVNLIWTAVPEPSVSLSAGLAGLLLVFRRRRTTGY